MVREIITVNVGQAGIQMSSSIWTQYCCEHGVGLDGRLVEKKQKEVCGTFFTECASGQYVPRNLTIDLEPMTVDTIRNGQMKSLFNDDYLLNGIEDAANNFARGHYTVGREMIDSIDSCLNKLVESCDHFQGFILNHSIGGGTGSGLGVLMLEHINSCFRNASTIGFEVYPSENINTAVVEPYNALLSIHYLTDLIDLSIVLDNEALYSINQRKLGIRHPSYNNLNSIIAKAASSITASLRFPGDLNVDIQEYKTNLVPFPRLHFMTTALSPLVNIANMSHEVITCKSITEDVLRPESMLVKYEDFNVYDDKYMAIMLNYRGDIQSKNVSESVQWLKQTDKVQLVEWCPTGFKMGLNSVVPATQPNDDIAPQTKHVTMIANNVAISRAFSTRIVKKYDIMMSQRAFVHWYVGEGMEEGEFTEARESLKMLEEDYLDVLLEVTSDDGEEY